MPLYRTRALVALTVTAFIWGFTTVVVRTLAVAVGARDILPIRMAISLTVMAAVLTATGGWRVERRDLPRVILFGFLSVAGYNALSAFGLERTTASLAGLILGTEPLYIALFAALLLGEKVRPVTMLGLGLAAVGTAFLVLRGDAATTPAHDGLSVVALAGPLLVLASAVTWSLGTCWQSRSSRRMAPRASPCSPASLVPCRCSALLPTRPLLRRSR
jgi:drug/metabolite transporter (DMT)-like permease